MSNECLFASDRIQDHFSDLQAAFRQFDSHNKGHLNSKDIENLLGRLDLLIDDDQLFDLLQRFGFNVNLFCSQMSPAQVCLFDCV